MFADVHVGIVVADLFVGVGFVLVDLESVNGGVSAPVVCRAAFVRCFSLN